MSATGSRGLGARKAWLAVCALFWLTPGIGHADPVVQKIQELAESTDPAERRGICAQILAMEPRTYARHFCDGYEAIYLGLVAEAEHSLSEALAAQPDFALAAILYGEAYEQLGKPRLAERYYQWAIEVQPRRTDGRHALGMLYLREAQQGRTEQYANALEAFRQMAEVSPSSPDGFSNMGYVLTQMDRFEDAETLFQKAISKAPDDPAIHDNLAALYARWDRPEDAEREWKKSLSINPTYGSAVVELSSLHGRQGQLLEAMTILQAAKAAVVAPPWGPKVRRNLGYAFLGAGNAERARNAFIEGASAGSADALTHLGLAHARMLEGNTATALGAFRRGTALDSTLAVPFVRAWKSTLRYALEGEDEAGVLARLIARLDQDGSPDPVLEGATGADASPRLVAFVLEDWNFENADLVVQQFEEAEKRITEEGYDTPPVPTTQVAAKYPDQAQDQGLEGEVLVKVSIDETGKVIEALVERTNADRQLIEAALEAAQKWTFQPAVRYGSPVASTIVIPFKFSRKR